MSLTICPIRDWASREPDRIAFRDQSRTLTYGEADLNISSLVRSLLQCDIVCGQRVAVLASNSVEYALLIFALQRTGASFVPLNLRLCDIDWAKRIELTQCSCMIFDDDYAEAAAELNIKSVALLDLYPREDDSDQISEASQLGLDVEREASVVFSSGSTGESKAVCLSVKNHFSAAESSNRHTGLAIGHVWLVSLPLYHVSGLEILYRTVLAGACAYLLKAPNAHTISPVLELEPITHISVVPVVLEKLLDKPEVSERLNSLEMILVGGAPISKELLSKVIEKSLPVRSSYGMTETTAHVTLLPVNAPIEKLSTVGQVLPHVELELGNKNTDGVGEVMVRGSSVFLSYLDNNRPLSMDGWFNTRDLGVLDEDGFLTILGRIEER